MARLFAHLPLFSSSFDFTNGGDALFSAVRKGDSRFEGHEILCFTREQLLQLKEAIQVSGASYLFGIQVFGSFRKQGEEMKNQANEALKGHKFSYAIDLYTKAIELNGNNVWME